MDEIIHEISSSILDPSQFRYLEKNYSTVQLHRNFRRK